MASTVDVFAPTEGRDFNLGAFSGDTFNAENPQSFEFDSISELGDAGGSTNDMLAFMKSQRSSDRKAAKKVSDNKTKLAAGFGVAKSAAAAFGAIKQYEHIEAQGRFNISLANQQFRETIAFGKSAALREETKGFARGEQAKLKAIAQGQSATGGVATSAQKAEETLAILNATAIETNAIRQAYGYKDKAAMIQHEVNLAKITRDNRLITEGISALSSLVSTFI